MQVSWRKESSWLTMWAGVLHQGVLITCMPHTPAAQRKGPAADL